MLVVFRRSVLGQERVESGQFDDEPCSTIGRILGGQPSAVLLYDALTQIQAESQSSGGLVAVRLDETIEDLIAAFDRHADPVVAHGDDRVARMWQPQRDLDRRIAGTELERVVDQVREHLLDAQRVQTRLDRARRVDRDTSLGVASPREVDHVHHHVAQVGLRANDDQLAGINAGGVHEPFDHAGQSNGLVIDARQTSPHLL
jgi:hypothetical protein